MLVVAFNYGARQEIVRAVQRITDEIANGRMTSAGIDMDSITGFLDAPDIPDSELVFVPTYWPDFDRATLESAIREYQQRERRFGGLVAQTGS